MSKSSSGGFISLPTIIFLIVMYNIIFDDDEDKKQTEVKLNDTQTITETKEKEDWNEVKETLKTAVQDVKDAAIELKEEIKKELASEEKEKKSDPVEKPKEKAPVVVAEPEEENEPEEKTGRKL